MKKENTQEKQPKYKIGQKVYVLKYNKVKTDTIIGICMISNEFYYHIGKIRNIIHLNCDNIESIIYATKEELLASL